MLCQFCKMHEATVAIHGPQEVLHLCRGCWHRWEMELVSAGDIGMYTAEMA